MRAEDADLLAELQRLCARLPVPDAGWHAYVALIARARADFERALAVCAERPAVLATIGAAIAGDLDAAFDETADPALAEAYASFRALPIPEGQHPFLDELLPTLEAIEATLVALSLDPAAARSFAAARAAVTA